LDILVFVSMFGYLTSWIDSMATNLVDLGISAG
jgi:hypothetical protein